MTRNIVLHVDGSRVLRPDRTGQGIGWALVACHDDAMHERHDALLHGRLSPLSGNYEHLAFIQGVLYAHQLGFDFRNVTIYCDDTTFGYAQTYLHPANGKGLQADRIRKCVAHVVKHCFTPEVEPLVFKAFEHSRIHKLKGHQYEVYQERSDYLARHAAKSVCGLESAPPLSFEDWLKAGLVKYGPDEEAPTRWYAPFVGTSEAE